MERRDFLKTAAGVVAGLTLTESLPAAPVLSSDDHRHLLHESGSIYRVPVPWYDLAQSTPLRDLMQAAALQGRSVGDQLPALEVHLSHFLEEHAWRGSTLSATGWTMLLGNENKADLGGWKHKCIDREGREWFVFHHPGELNQRFESQRYPLSLWPPLLDEFTTEPDEIGLVHVGDIRLRAFEPMLFTGSRFDHTFELGRNGPIHHSYDIELLSQSWRGRRWRGHNSHAVLGHSEAERRLKAGLVDLNLNQRLPIIFGNVQEVGK